MVRDIELDEGNGDGGGLGVEEKIEGMSEAVCPNRGPYLRRATRIHPTKLDSRAGILRSREALEIIAWWERVMRGEEPPPPGWGGRKVEEQRRRELDEELDRAA